MATGMELVKRDVSRRGVKALVALAVTGVFVWNGWWLMTLIGLATTAWMGYRWFALRAKWGLRF